MLFAVTYCFSLWGQLAEVVTPAVKLSREGCPMERLRCMVESNIVLVQTQDFYMYAVCNGIFRVLGRVLWHVNMKQAVFDSRLV